MMKHKLMPLILLTVLPLFSLNAQADRPCKKIVEACMSAGIVQAGSSRQLMMANCVKPVLAGGIAGVQVDPSVIQACKAKIAAQK
jgi:hypothetical protein